MKRIILILALLSLGVSKAQVVGGYLPLNSTKSATMGGLRINGNETVTGTFSVGSTATVSGNALFSSSVGIGALPTSSSSAFRMVKGTATLDIGGYNSSNPGIWFGASSPQTNNANIFGSNNNLEINGGTRVYLEAGQTAKVVVNSTGMRVGSNSDPNAVLDVTGDAKVSSTFSLGSANLTGGNTGTVAVLSDVESSFDYVSNSSFNPADATNYYYGMLWPSYSGEITNAVLNQIMIPYNCNIYKYQIGVFNNGTVGSSESVTIALRVNNTTDNTIISNMVTTGATTTYTGTLNIDITANDLTNIKFISPTWSTNPTTVFLYVKLYCRRRS